MENKSCSKCKDILPITEFDIKGVLKSGGRKYSSHCKKCRKAYVKSHYQRNKKYYVKKARKNDKNYLKYYEEYKKTLSCSDCGLSFEKEPYLCDFHHVSKDKEAQVGKFKYSKPKFFREVIKCIPLCANCHRRRHHKKQLGTLNI